MTNKISSLFVMIMLVEVISVQERLLPKFYSVDFIGLLFFVIPMRIVQLVIDVKNWEVSEEEI